MMGVSHATSGAAAGLLGAQLAPDVLGIHSPRQAMVFAAVCAGYAILPDIDHESALATRRFSVVSWLACRLVRPLSEWAFRTTASNADGHHSHRHRGLTHTLVAAILTGAAAALAITRWGNPAVWTVMFIGLAFAVKGLDALIPGPPSLLAAGALTWWGTGTLPWQHVPAPATAWLGIAVSTGMFIHLCGDSLTESGCPVFAPIRIRGRGWYPVRPPAGLRLHTGRGAEKVVLVGLTVATVVLAVQTVPGLWSALTGRGPQPSVLSPPTAAHTVGYGLRGPSGRG